MKRKLSCRDTGTKIRTRSIRVGSQDQMHIVAHTVYYTSDQLPSKCHTVFPDFGANGIQVARVCG